MNDLSQVMGIFFIYKTMNRFFETVIFYCRIFILIISIPVLVGIATM